MTLVGAGHGRKTNHVLEGWGFEPFNVSVASREKRGLKTECNLIANDSINLIYIMKP